MKSRQWKRLTALFCAFALILSLSPAISAAGTPASSRNINKQDYVTYGNTVTSYLYENDRGGVTRVEYTGGTIIVEDYDSAYALADSRTVDVGLPIWGGFFAGADANFVISGQTNQSESDSAEVIRVEKYSKDWRYEGEASLRGANTTVPFDAGSLRCAEYGGYLYIRTCHEMYESEDGLNHQSNLTMQVDEDSMEVVDAYYDIYCVDYGYISHSFNQFILIDDERSIIGLDHGDAGSLSMGPNWQPIDVNTRGATLVKYTAHKAGESGFTANAQKFCDYSIVENFAGRSGDNTTGASIGGLAETSGGYVSVFNYDGVGGRSNPRDVYLGYTSKSGLSSSARVISESSGTTTPVLAPMGLGGGYVMWNGKSGSTPDDTLYYAAYSDGGQVGRVETDTASLSDCQPIYHDGMAVWYVTDDSEPVFYGLDENGVTVLNNGSEGPDEPDNPDEPDEPTPPAGDLTVERCALAQPTFSHSKAVLKNGDLYGWGHAGTNLGVSDKTDANGNQYQSVPVKLDQGYISISGAYNAGIKPDNSLWIFEEEVNGGKAGPKSAPEKVMEHVSRAALDAEQGLVVKTDGTLWGWGLAWMFPNGTVNRTPAGAVKLEAGMNGVKQIFWDTEGTVDSYSVLDRSGDLWTDGGLTEDHKPRGPVKIMSDVAAFTRDGIGYGIFYAIKTDGALYTWSKRDPSTKLPIGVEKVMDDVVDVDMHYSSGAMALTSDGTVYFLGGDSPVKIMDGAVAIDGGNILKADGSLWSKWDGATGRVSDDFRKVLDGVLLPGEVSEPDEPTPPAGDLTAMLAAPTFSWSTAVKTNGDLYGWGDARSNMGVGSLPGFGGNDLVAFQAEFTKIDSGYIASGDCWGVKPDHSLWVWGYDHHTPGYENRDETVWLTTPLKVMDDVLYADVSEDTIALALKRDGTLWGWGREDELMTGKLNNGKAIPYTQAVKLMDNVKQFGSYYRYWWVLDNDGNLFRWNPFADSGTGFIKYMEDVAAFSVDPNGNTQFVIKNDGSLWGWGGNDLCQLGQGYDQKYDEWPEVDQAVKIMDNVVYAYSGCTQCYAITADGVLYGWGANDKGELGFTGGDVTVQPSYTVYRPTLCQSTPKRLMDGVVAVDMGYVLKKDGTIWTTEYYTRTASSVDCSWGAYHKVLDGVLLPGETPEPDEPTPPVGKLTVEQCMLAAPTFTNGKAVLKNGDLYSWGPAYTNLGKGDKTNSNGGLYQSTPMKIDSGYIAVESPHMGVKADHSLWGWTENYIATPLPAPKKLADNVFRVEGRAATSGVLLRPDGTLSCWNVRYPGMTEVGHTPDTAVKYMDGVKQISEVLTEVNNCTAFLKNDGSLWEIQLRNGEFVLMKVMDGVAAFDWSYEKFLAIDKSGNLYTWYTREEPVQILKELGPIVAARHYSDREGYFLTADGTLYCGSIYGKNVKKALDNVVAFDYHYALRADGSLWTTWDPATDQHTGTFHKFLDGVLLPGETPEPDEPTPPVGKLTVEKCALAQPTFCYGKAVLKNGDLYSWGTASRNLGVGDKTNASGGLYQSVPMKLDSGYISVGTEYWGIKSDNSLWTWWDLVPNGFEEVTNPPVKKADNVAFAVRGYTSDMSGGGMTLRPDGSLYTWGSNWFPGVDARGTGPAEAVKCMDGVKQISAIETMNDFCFLKKDGTLWGIDMKRGERFLVKTMDNVAAFEMHYGAFYAIKTDGSLYKWTGSTAKVPSAAEVTKVMDGVVDVTCFRGICYFLTSDGTLYKTRSAPDAEIVKVMDGVVAIEDNCALKADGSLWTTWDPATDDVTENTFRKLLDNVLLPRESVTRPSRPGNSSSSGSSTPGTIMTNNGGGAGARPGTATKPNLPAEETKPANPFTDVSEGAYYYDAVLWALENGITTGVTETEFRPSATCTRGQVVTFLWRAKGSPEPKTQTNPFTDVSPSSPFYKAILWAYENGITAGQTAASFNPGGSCTSSHVITFLWRANGKPAASGTSSLAAANSGKYYTDAVAWADTAGLLSGVGAAFAPGNNSPRADIVTYLYRDMAD